jgi:hypothetical protein
MSHRCIVAVIVGSLVIASGSHAGAAPKKPSASVLYERRVEAYRQQLAAYQQQQSDAALRAADALSAKLERQRQWAIHDEALKRYQHAQMLAAQGAAQRLAAKLERLYGRHESNVATGARPVTLAIRPALAPPSVAPHAVASKPPAHRAVAQSAARLPARPPVSSLPTTPSWYGWGSL